MKVEREFNSEYDFMKKYGRKYPKHKLDTDYHPSSTAEIQQMKYASNNLKYYDIYESLVNKLLELGFDIGCNILDVASGYYPAFGYEIAGRQLQLNKGNVTCIDPNLVVDTPFHKNVKLTKDSFTKSYDISNYDLIVSSLPCEVSLELFELLMKTQKSFFVYPCNCSYHIFKNNSTKLFWVDLFYYCIEYERINSIESNVRFEMFENNFSSKRAIIYKK